MKKILAIALCLIMLLSLVACNTPDNDGDKNDGADNNGKPAEKQSINVCLASEPDTLDPALNSAVDGATMIAHLFSGLAKWSEDENGNLVIVADLATELVKGVQNDDGSVTYTYTLRDGLKWSNGDALTAKDFENSWKRAASAELGAD